MRLAAAVVFRVINALGCTNDKGVHLPHPSRGIFEGNVMLGFAAARDYSQVRSCWFETANPAWWPTWDEWVSWHAGGSVKARELGGPLQAIEDRTMVLCSCVPVDTAAANKKIPTALHQVFFRDRL